MYSTDGITWTTATTVPSNEWQAVAYGNGTFVAVAASGSNRAMRSTDDGVTWTGVTLPEDGNKYYGVAYGNGTFVAVASDGSNRVIYSTDDGVTWTAGTTP